MQKRYEKFNIYWDIEKNVPKILKDSENKNSIEEKKYRYVATDLRPVFVEEKHLLLNMFPEIFDEDIYDSSIWATKLNRYIIDGKVMNIKVNSRAKEIMNSGNLDIFRKKVIEFKFPNEVSKFEKNIFKKFIEVNRNHFNDLIKSEEKDEEGYYIGAYPFIRTAFENYSNRLHLVSFSGGKDSTVVSHLVRKALNNPSILHIFGDTTLELPKTYEYVEKFKEENVMTPFLDEKNEENNFFEICEEIGPPSRVKSWCCSIFKTGPMGTTLSNFDEYVLTFLGIRRPESSSRSKYKRISQSPKIIKQNVALPMVDWLDIDVWLYLLTEDVAFNYSYRQGFTRVGCWVCPHNSDWSTFLSSVYNSKEYDKWYDFLINFAKQIGKEDYKDYIGDGYWKARQGGAGLEKSRNVILETKECVNEENSKNYILSKNIDSDFYQLFKPFGKLKNSSKGKIEELYIISKKDNSSIFKLMFKFGSNELKVAVINSNDRYILNKIEKQLNKFNSCMYCLACNSACPVGAISVSNKKYFIDKEKCINCLKCIDKFDSGCLITSALKIKKGS
jgi:phosphoadenosine phosphosulfate reductase